MIILLKKNYKLYSLRSHRTSPSNKSTSHSTVYQDNLIVVMATVPQLHTLTDYHKLYQIISTAIKLHLDYTICYIQNNDIL